MTEFSPYRQRDQITKIEVTCHTQGCQLDGRPVLTEAIVEADTGAIDIHEEVYCVCCGEELY